MTSGTGIFRPLQSDDDGSQPGVGSGNIVGVINFMCNAGGTIEKAGVRFRNVTIPKGSFITSAVVSFYCDANSSANDTANAIIKGEKNANPPLFTIASANWNNRVRTTAQVLWNAIPHWVTGQHIFAPDCSSVVQEIVNLPDWVSGNNLVIFIEDNASTASAQRKMASWDNVTYEEPILTVSWIVPPPVEVIKTSLASIPSHFSQTGLSISVHKRLAQGGNFLFNITDTIETYTHEINASGGFGAATITMKSGLSKLDDWLQDGVGRHIVVYNRAMKSVYEGFVNKVSANIGGVSAVRGPLLDVCNRLSIVYSPILDDTVDPIVVGATTVTTISEEKLSQSKYGILEKVLSTGNALESEIYYAQMSYLIENQWPVRTNEINITGEKGDISITIECEGYNKWLGAYIYEDDASLSVQASTKIQNVLIADPNNFISSDYSKLTFNGILCPSQEIDNKTAQDVIDSIVVVGDLNYLRCIFGIYENRRAFYNSMPTTVEYVYRLSEGRQVLETPNGVYIQPWDIRPGKWVMTPEILVGKQMDLGLRLDQRALFIEKVTYTAPYGLALTGEKTNTIAQKFQQMGLGGMS